MLLTQVLFTNCTNTRLSFYQFISVAFGVVALKMIIYLPWIERILTLFPNNAVNTVLLATLSEIGTILLLTMPVPETTSFITNWVPALEK